MNRILRFAVYLPLLLLLSRFFWSDPTWEEVNRTIDRKYPAVRNINTESLKTFLDQGTHEGKQRSQGRASLQQQVGQTPQAGTPPVPGNASFRYNPIPFR
jgi:hypothetical protein